jgi:hypothetical protein
MNCSQKKIAHSSKEITMAQMKKPMVKLNKKVYGEAVDKAFEANKKAQEKTAVKKTTTKMPAMARPTAKKAAAKPAVKVTPKTTTKAPAKKKVVQMPSKISPSKMTPAQKAKYLANPERYDG